jgi:hypothetical protein
VRHQYFFCTDSDTASMKPSTIIIPTNLNVKFPIAAKSKATFICISHSTVELAVRTFDIVVSNRHWFVATRAVIELFPTDRVLLFAYKNAVHMNTADTSARSK